MYIISDLLYLIVYKLAGYRKNVVNENLRNSFPGKSNVEILRIQDSFYHYLFDLFLETFKTLTIRPESLIKRVTMEEDSIFKKYFNKGKSVIIVMGHFGNWELAGARFSQFPYHKLNVIYHPLKNKYFNNLVIHMRTRLGNGLYTMNETLRSMLRDRNILTATAFIADQAPSPKGAYWTKFLNQDTPVFTGPAKIAKKLDYPVIYVSVARKSRGRYHLKSELLVEHPKNLLEDEISELHTKRLEKDILAHPEIWLWSHKRWKHVKPTE